MLTNLKEEKFPSELKLANVINLYKKMREIIEPIIGQFLLHLLTKFFEKLADGRLFACKKIINQQTIFQKYSTVDALVYFTELVRGELRENKFTTCAYLDLSKAFE